MVNLNVINLSCLENKTIIPPSSQLKGDKGEKGEKGMKSLPGIQGRKGVMVRMIIIWLKLIIILKS